VRRPSKRYTAALEVFAAARGDGPGFFSVIRRTPKLTARNLTRETSNDPPTAIRNVRTDPAAEMRDVRVRALVGRMQRMMKTPSK
jgi:hypothetical protein